MISSFQFTTPAVSLSTQGAEQGLSLPLEPPVSGTCPLLENLLSLSTFLLLAEIQKDRELRPQRTYLVSHSTKPRFLFFYLFSLLSPTLYSSTISFWSLGFIKEEEGGGSQKGGYLQAASVLKPFQGVQKAGLFAWKVLATLGVSCRLPRQAVLDSLFAPPDEPSTLLHPLCALGGWVARTASPMHPCLLTSSLFIQWGALDGLRGWEE